MSNPRPTLVPLGDSSILIRFSNKLDDDANRAAVAFAKLLENENPSSIAEITPNLVSVLIRYDSHQTTFGLLSGELRLLLAREKWTVGAAGSAPQAIPTRYGGELGPDLGELAASLSMPEQDFVTKHAAANLRVLATGFAPGFVYCGFHHDLPSVPRRQVVRKQVPAGTILFAAGQTAIAATPIPTGWHVIGHTGFSNFDATKYPPTMLTAGDPVSFPEVTA